MAIVIKKGKLKQILFHEHYCSEGHSDRLGWGYRLIKEKNFTKLTTESFFRES